ncbi:MAG: hypothetical protein UT36_C0001G0163 [Candidatus Peregrinibacteria bacterium GW2011_GWF2_39_17]|nr:MAG: hypothetical protein UT36_C0001G0163 [Candidatus Peregrinibacteria bacterium GW2011_GWF2_39_17]HCW32601.1 hypothetical protein [Candidatus Peregrinibacteria bacterium]
MLKKMFKVNYFLVILLELFLIISSIGCIGKTKNYQTSKDPTDPNFEVITMKTFDLKSKYFTFNYELSKWDLQEWDITDAPNRLALVNKNYPEGQCVILPGTTGLGRSEGNQVIEGSLVTTRYSARTLDVFNPIGIQLLHVVGYEVEDFPYIFEVRMPTKDPDQCVAEAQAVVSTFDVEKTVEPATTTT